MWYGDVSFSTMKSTSMLFLIKRKKHVSSSMDELEPSKRQGLCGIVKSVHIECKYFTAVLATYRK